MSEDWRYEWGSVAIIAGMLGWVKVVTGLYLMEIITAHLPHLFG